MLRNNFELEVFVGSHRLKEFGKDGNTYIEGRKDQPFTLKLHNNSSNRILVVISIDGLSIIDGERATSNSIGYVLEGNSHPTIQGWRISNKEVREFIFTTKDKSFAGKTDKDITNCGVIGCLVYSERPKVVYRSKSSRLSKSKGIGHWNEPTTGPIGWCSSDTVQCNYLSTSPGPIGNELMATMDSHSAETPEFDLGTGYGDTKADYVGDTTFIQDKCIAEFEIFYASRESLLEIGIDVSKSVKVQKRPQAFEDRFCKMPD